MTDNYPITPPPELVQQWIEATKSPGCVDVHLSDWEQRLATQAARWGFDQRTVWDAEWLEAQLQRARDQELEACCEWLDNTDVDDSQEAAKHLRAARRPKPLSLKQQALLLCNDYIDPEGIIRRALEQLDD